MIYQSISTPFSGPGGKEIYFLFLRYDSALLSRYRSLGAMFISQSFQFVDSTHPVIYSSGKGHAVYPNISAKYDQHEIFPDRARLPSWLQRPCRGHCMLRLGGLWLRH